MRKWYLNQISGFFRKPDQLIPCIPWGVAVWPPPRMPVTTRITTHLGLGIPTESFNLPRFFASWEGEKKPMHTNQTKHNCQVFSPSFLKEINDLKGKSTFFSPVTRMTAVFCFFFWVESGRDPKGCHFLMKIISLCMNKYLLSQWLTF